MNRALRVLLLIVLVWACGCGDTGIAFEIVSEFPYGGMDGGMVEQMQALGVSVTDRDDRTVVIESRSFSVPGEVSRFPAWVVVNRRSDSARGVHAEFRVCRSAFAADGRARGCITDGQEVMLTHPITVAYREGTVREIRIELLPECLNFPCAEGQRCTRGPRCVSEVYDDGDAATARDMDPSEDIAPPVDRTGDATDEGEEVRPDWMPPGDTPPPDGPPLDRTDASEESPPMDAPDDVRPDVDAPGMDAPRDLPSADIGVDETCPGMQRSCAAMCVDVATSIAHCGRCNNACLAAANASPTCVRGMCGLQCAAGFANCDGLASNGCETNLATTPAHCGACGRACAARQVCSGGLCMVTCAAVETNCSGACVNTQTDPGHCSGCGRACAVPANAIATCASGACGFVCNSGFADCDRVAANGCEVNVRGSDANNCGGCGVRCAFTNAATSCAMGTCVIGACNAGFGNCDGAAPNGCETNLATTPSHCGACLRACALPNVAAHSCVGGVCGVGTCATGFGNCDGAAPNGCEVNIATSVQHCGGCGVRCPADRTCQTGLCRCTTGLADCGGVCVDLQFTDTHCGRCNRQCPSGTRCNGGGCTCPAGQTPCGPVCVLLGSDNANCGACGRACLGGQSCAGGTCICASGLTFCGGSCVDTRSNDGHCGMCGRACSSGQTCAGGACVCPTGQTNCGGVCRATGTTCTSGGSVACQQSGTVVCQGTGTACSAAPRTSGACTMPSGGSCDGSGNCVCAAGQTNCGGACRSLGSDPSNCGACSNVCVARTNGSVTCSGGSCNYACNAGFGDCDSNPANGCEVSTTSNASHCGACGSRCMLPFATSSCVSGACAIVECAIGRADADGLASNGCERDATTGSFCGRLGDLCDGLESCQFSMACVDYICWVGTPPPECTLPM